MLRFVSCGRVNAEGRVSTTSNASSTQTSPTCVALVQQHKGVILEAQRLMTSEVERIRVDHGK